MIPWTRSGTFVDSPDTLFERSLLFGIVEIAWVAIDGKVYGAWDWKARATFLNLNLTERVVPDVSKFAENHPGGKKILLRYAGKDGRFGRSLVVLELG